MRKHLAISLRLSSEDMNARSNRLNDESDSIRNQRLLVEQYISGKPELAKYPTVEYSDDGYPDLWKAHRPHSEDIAAAVRYLITL